ncbi:MAG: AAA family ATPase [Firmicutes bacterium]|nr:AAA family ATPase [Bacillota bacterium]
MFPRRTSIWLPLLKVLSEAGGALRPSEATERVEAYFPKLTEDDKRYMTPKGRLRWAQHDVPWARYDLVKQGLMRNTPGIWEISDDGRAYLEAQWESWEPQYVQRNGEWDVPDSETDASDDVLPPPRYWWVNQGQSYETERDGGYIWAPLKTTGGSTIAHWARVKEVLPGDILVHYSNGAVRAISIANGEVQERDNPHANSEWERRGLAVAVQYYELSMPYPRERFPDSLVRMNLSDGPFNREGQVKQGYLWRFSAEALQMLTDLSDFPWPSGLPIERPRGSSVEVWEAHESVSKYGGEPFDLRQAYDVIAATGYRISIDDVLNVLLALEVRPFVIFSGRSGTGKTLLTRILASLFGWPYYMVPVSPAWTDPADLLGFVSPLSRQRVPGALEDLLVSNNDDALLCLDEFNIAKVEHYFSDFISAMENGSEGFSRGLFPKLQRLSVNSGESFRLPPRLRVIATMNFDDSVQSITPRVLDRANVLDFNVPSVDVLVVDRSIDLALVNKTNFQWPWNGERVLADPETFMQTATMIRDIWPALRGSRGQFAHRVAQEMCRYIALGLPFAGDLGRNTEEQREFLLDRQIAQRILPKFHGTAADRDIEALMRLMSALRGYEWTHFSTMDRLAAVDDFRNWNHFPRTADKIEQLVTSYTRDGYATFW